MDFKKLVVVIAILSPVFVQAQDVEKITVDNAIFNMIKVEGGSVRMGEKNSNYCAVLDTYYIGETEVTQELWEAVMGENPSEFKGPKRPVDNVSWDKCQEFIAKLNTKTGKTFRLPTEAEWEFAAKGGIKSKNTEYSGNSTLSTVGWYYANGYTTKTQDAKKKKPNELKIYDMSGNISEWCSDFYGSYPSDTILVTVNNPKGAKENMYHVVRGGSYCHNPEGCEVSSRSFASHSESKSYIGLRLAE